MAGPSHDTRGRLLLPLRPIQATIHVGDVSEDALEGIEAEFESPCSFGRFQSRHVIFTTHLMKKIISIDSFQLTLTEHIRTFTQNNETAGLSVRFYAAIPSQTTQKNVIITAVCLV